MKFNVARKYRIYPDEEQIIIIENTFSMVRLTWNKLLEKASNSYFDPEETFCIVNYCDIVSEYPFMDKSNKEFVFDRHATSNTKLFLRRAFNRFFDKFKKKPEFTKKGKPKNFPRFKSRKYSKNSYTNYNVKHSGFGIDYTAHTIKLPCLGWVKFNKREKPIPEHWNACNVTISKSSFNKYYVSICFEYEDDTTGINCTIDEFKIHNPKRNINILGLDYSSGKLYVDSNNHSSGYPRYYRKNQKRLRILQKRLSRKQKGSVSYEEIRLQLASFHEHIANKRKDFLHKLSTSITKMYDVISLEDLNMSAMSQCLKLGKSTLDNGFGMFRDMLIYKQMRIPFHIVYFNDKWYPSSKTCSHCGHLNYELTLKDRIYRCPDCGFIIDRDLNAAINLKYNALKALNELLVYEFQFVSV